MLSTSAVVLRPRHPRKHPDPATVGPLAREPSHLRQAPPAVASPAPIGHRPKGNPRAQDAHSAQNARGYEQPRAFCVDAG